MESYENVMESLRVDKLKFKRITLIFDGLSKTTKVNVFFGLKRMDSTEQQTYVFKSDMKQCSSMCMSKELKDVCRTVSTCDAKSVCHQNKACVCTLKYGCETKRVSEQSVKESNMNYKNITT